MPQIATKITYGTLDAALVISTGSIRVSDILVTNASASNVVAIFRDNDNNIKLRLAVLAHDSNSWGAKWIADNGLKVDSLSDSDISVSVAHSADGA